MNTVYRQVELQRAVENAIEVQTCWIPAQFAKKGKVLSIKVAQERGCFSSASDLVHGWVVEKVYGSLSTKQELDRQRASRRDLSSIVLPEAP